MSSSAPSAVAAPATSGTGAGPTPAPAAQPEGTSGQAPRKIAPIPPKAKAEPAKDMGPDPVVHKDEPAKATEADPKPKRSGGLPGVVTAEDAPELPVRGPDGRFISHEEAARIFNAELDGDDGVRIEGEEPPPTPEKSAEPPKKPTLPGQTGKVTFLGKEYENIAAVEQMYRSLQGMHDPIAKKLSQTEKDRDYGYEAANKWEQAAREARAELEQFKKTGGRVAPTAQDAGPGESKLDLTSLVDGINYDAFEAIAHDPKGGTRVAGQYLTSQILNTVLSKIVPAVRAELLQEFSPVKQAYQQTAEQAQTANAVQQTIDAVANYQTLDGKPAFPELLDEQALVEVAQTWRESGLPPQAALTPQGLINAIGLYRLMKSLPAGIEAAAPPEPAVPGPEIAALAEGTDGAHTGLGRTPEPSHLGPDARALRRSLDEAPIFDRTLGFTVNRRR